jgi:glycosyltransferase involved in cell wall biosynthesis
VRILYFSKDYSPHDHRFLSAIVQGGHEAYYLKLERNLRQTEERPVPSQVEQIPWAGGKGEFRWRDIPRLTFDLRRVVRKIKPNLIHAGPIQTCALLAVLSGFHPLLTMSWGFDLMQDVHRSWWTEWATHYVLRNSTFYTSDAQVTRDKAVTYGMNPEHTCVIPWGVDLNHFKPRSSENENCPTKSVNAKSFVILTNRSWEPRYGVDVLAKAFVQAARQNENLSLILLGGGSQAAIIRSILIGGGVLERVHFGGQISHRDLPDWYHMSNLFVSPSHVDGASVSLMEALACGLPALVSDIPGNKEWVNEGVNGWLYPDGDADALAGKILAVVDQKEKLSGIGHAARRSAEKRADWNKNATLLMQVYETTVKLGGFP